jgi:hypothetical protein
MTFAADRRCVQCGCRWKPGCPRWAGFVFILVGLFFVTMGVLSVLAFSASDIILVAAAVLIGLPAIGYGIGAILGKASRIEIVEHGRVQRF